MRISRPRAAVVVMWFAALAGWASAQDTKGQADALKELRARDALADDDKAKIQQFVESNVEKVKPDDAAGADEGIRSLRDGANGSSAFREAYAAACVRAISEAYKRAELKEAARLVSVLGELNETPVCEVLTQALRDDRAAVRTAAAIGLRKLRVKISIAGGKVLSEALDALREAGARETSAATLKLIYDALDYPSVVPNPPEPKANAEALLVILDARAEQYSQGKVRAEGADAEGLKTATSLQKLMGDAEKRRLSVSAARMLRHGVAQYIAAGKDNSGSKLPAAQRNDTERLVLTAEKLLATLIAPAGDVPNIAKFMEKVDLTRVHLEYNKWAAEFKRALDVDLSIDALTSQPAGDGGG